MSVKRELKHIENDIYYCVKSDRYVKKVKNKNLYRWFYYPYSKTKRIIGVYYIYDKLFDKYYIGSSIDVIGRINAHMTEYKSNNPYKDIKYQVQLCHKGKFIEYGLLEKCSKEDLPELERYYIRLADSVNNGWNRSYNTRSNWLRSRDWKTNSFYTPKE